MPTAAELASRLIGRDLEAPFPGSGRTPERHRWLAQWGRNDLSAARIVEGHVDALAILAEGDRRPQHRGLYGVWASDGPQGRLHAQEVPGGWRLNGTKQYCSGADFLAASLVTAHSEAGLLLLEVPLSASGIRPQPSTWETPAMADTSTAPVMFENLILPETSVVGSPDWYLQRPGFWHGALGPAACWAGGAMCLVDAAAALKPKNPHSKAHVGALLAASWGLSALLEEAGREIDCDPRDVAGVARVRALKVRHLIERTCSEVLDRFGRATGPQLLAYAGCIARQHMALSLYIRQCHAERDLEMIPEG